MAAAAVQVKLTSMVNEALPDIPVQDLVDLLDFMEVQLWLRLPA
jgi:hypothetical protein